MATSMCFDSFCGLLEDYEALHTWVCTNVLCRHQLPIEFSCFPTLTTEVPCLLLRHVRLVARVYEPILAFSPIMRPHADLGLPRTGLQQALRRRILLCAYDSVAPSLQAPSLFMKFLVGFRCLLTFILSHGCF